MGTERKYTRIRRASIINPGYTAEPFLTGANEVEKNRKTEQDKDKRDPRRTKIVPIN